MFKFFKFDLLSDGEIDLSINLNKVGDETLGYLPAYHYNIKEHGMHEVVGQIDIRIGHNINTFYGGNIGYGIEEGYRGKGYAAKAVLLLKNVARKHHLKEVIITCNPDNLASRKTAEKAGGILLEIVDLPEDNEMYKLGERQKCRYELSIE